MEIQPEVMSDSKPISKPPIIRGARACTVCRTAKMKCVGAEDGQKPCDRCKRANVECIFEKHRRGRKPGSKLSEASKMLRRLEKGLNSAKMKSQTTDARILDQDGLFAGSRSTDGRYSSSSSQFPSKDLPPLNMSNYAHGEGYAHSSIGSRSVDMDEEEDADRNEDAIFPEKLIRRENQRTSFFRTILNPEAAPTPNDHSSQSASLQNRPTPFPTGLDDPITAGIITEEDAIALFDNIFIRLNPFINLFDPALHTVTYVRSKCPFLFTTLIMAGCKFFKPDSFKQCQKLANEFAVRAFAEAWKRVEVVQAFACLTYWKDPDDKDNRTWTYIGYACRMAVELKLNRYVQTPPQNETEFQMLERRNRERTYLVLFVHDRSLNTQTGMHWMLPVDEMIRQSNSWHKQGGNTVRPEDVIVASFVSLRCIAAETTDIFKGAGSGVHHDVNNEHVLRTCNAKLTEWADFWQNEMDQAGGEKFHSSFLRFFRLYVRLFLNSFGIQATIPPSSRQSPSLQAVTTCCTSALDSLKIVSQDFAHLNMLPYGQESIMVMSAYSAVSLLRLLRSNMQLPTVDSQLAESSAHQIHAIISQTADAYQTASQISPQSTSAAVHARFLRHLLAYDVFKAQQNDRKQSRSGGMSIDPQLHSPPTPNIPTESTTQIYHDQFQLAAPSHICQEQEYTIPVFSKSITQNLGGPMAYNYAPQAPQCATEVDAHYWKHMFLELGFGDNEGTQVVLPQTDLPAYLETDNQLHQHINHPQGRLPYEHHMHQPSQMGSYGHQ